MCDFQASQGAFMCFRVNFHHACLSVLSNFESKFVFDVRIIFVRKTGSLELLSNVLTVHVSFTYGENKCSLQTPVLQVLHRERRLSNGSVTEFFASTRISKHLKNKRQSWRRKSKGEGRPGSNASQSNEPSGSISSHWEETKPSSSRRFSVVKINRMHGMQYQVAPVTLVHVLIEPSHEGGAGGDQRALDVDRQYQKGRNKGSLTGL